jgi:pimeloyl-ACP methyl ester carboxylesterase
VIGGAVLGALGRRAWQKGNITEDAETVEDAEICFAAPAPAVTMYLLRVLHCLGVLGEYCLADTHAGRNEPTMIRNEITLDERRLETAWWGPSAGEAPTLVLLHEGLGCVALWRDVPERLAAETGCGVFAYSRFGYGRSDPAQLPRPMTYMHDEALTVLPRVLIAARIERAVLLGHSDGGSIAAIYAGAVRDDRIAGLVLIAAHFFVEDLNLETIARIRDDYATTDLRSRLARHHTDVDNAFRGWNDAWLDPRFRAFDITAYLPGISVPVLALQGTDDPYGSAAQLDVLKRHMTAPLETRLILGARHAPHLEVKDATLAAIVRFAGSVLSK